MDITALQHDIAIIKNEVYKYKEIRENESIQLKELKEAVQQFIPKRDINIAKTASVTETDVAINCQGANSIISNNKQSYSKAVTNNLRNSSQYKKSNKSSELNVDLEKNKQENDWKTVKKRLKKSHIGKIKMTDIKSVKPVLKPAIVFISRLDPSTKEKDIEKFAKDQFNGLSKVICEKLITKYDTYNSFKVYLYGVTFKDSLNIDNWPEGILIKQFYYVENRKSTE